MKALAKEQKKALKKANAAGSNTESQEKEAVPNKTQEKGNPHEKGIPSQAAVGNPHNNPVEPHGTFISQYNPSIAIYNVKNKVNIITTRIKTASNDRGNAGKHNGTHRFSKRFYDD